MNNSNTSDTIRLDNLSIGYKTHDGIRTVAKDINASIKSGKLTCLVGTNGIGKSTLLRTLSGFQPRLGGSIVINGSELSRYTPRDLSRIVSVVLTSRPSSINFTVEEIVALGRTPYTGFWGTLNDTDKEIVSESIKLAGISHLAKRNAMSLSDGERQKMMIAKALAQQTPVIMLDEQPPFSTIRARWKQCFCLQVSAAKKERQYSCRRTTSNSSFSWPTFFGLWKKEEPYL